MRAIPSQSRAGMDDATQELWMGTLDETGTTFRMDREPVFSGSMLVRTAEPSPDGGRIAFTSDGIEDVYVLNADGTDLRQLTNDSARDRGVSWAPDGSKVYFYSTRGGTYVARENEVGDDRHQHHEPRAEPASPL